MQENNITEEPVAFFSQERGWQDNANCLGVDPDLFFPERGASTREAKEVCRGTSQAENTLPAEKTSQAK